MRKLIPPILILFLLTSATIIFEVGLSRLFSYMLSYHFVLIIIAFSILGLGIGQILYSKFSDSIDTSIHKWYALLPSGMILGYLSLLLLPRLAFFSSSNLSLLVFTLISIFPFIIIGIIYANVLRDHKAQVALLYGVDLLGAGVGALLSVFFLNALSLTMVVSVAAIMLLVAFSIKVHVDKQAYSKYLNLSLIIVLPLLWLGNGKLDLTIPIVNDASKDMLRLLNNPAINGEIIDSRWSAFGKTDLVNLSFGNGKTSQVLFIDGAAGSDVVNIDELLSDSVKMKEQINLGNFPALFALNFLEEEELDSALIIGPGGGIDIAASYLMGFEYIEAVEVNPSFVELMEIYNRPTFSNKENIRVHAKEGRYFVRENKGKYDALFLTIPVTKSGRGTDFYGLTENYLFTVEALSDYINSLTEEGSVFFTMHSQYEVYKMLSNYIKMKQRLGQSAEEAFKNVYIYSTGMKPVLVIRNQPFEQDRIEPIHLAAHRYGLDRDVFYFPYIKQISSDSAIGKDVNYSWFMFDEQLYDVSRGKYPFDNIVQSTLVNLNPVFDNSPYFFNSTKGLPEPIFIPFLLAVSIIVWFVIRQFRGWNIISPNENRFPLSKKKFAYFSLTAFLLGFSYFFLQSYLFQILNLKLSNPAQSFSLLLFTFLVGNGLGSLFTSYFKTELLNKLMLASLTIVLVSLLTVYSILPYFGTALSKIGIVMLLLIPSFFIGFPFPILLKSAAKIENKRTIPILLGISSVAGVAASIIAIVISILYGYTLVLLFGLLCYLTIALLAFGAERQFSIMEGDSKLAVM